MSQILVQRMYEDHFESKSTILSSKVIFLYHHTNCMMEKYYLGVCSHFVIRFIGNTLYGDRRDVLDVWGNFPLVWEIPENLVKFPKFWVKFPKIWVKFPKIFGISGKCQIGQRWDFPCLWTRLGPVCVIFCEGSKLDQLPGLARTR